MKLIVCDKSNSVLDNIIIGLPSNQGGSGRHKCVICAFNYGIEDGKLQQLKLIEDEAIEICKHGSIAPINRIECIHENQKHDQGRHKCLICAYQIGFNQSINLLNKSILANNIKLGELNNQSANIKFMNIKINGKKKSEKPIKIDYIKESRYKAELGLLGEKLVCKYEEGLGCQVSHLSLKDDSSGFDIESKKNNISKFIEVKTTTGSLSKPFYISKNELNFLTKSKENAFIYRVYNYNFSSNTADLYIIDANKFIETYELDCQSYVVIGIKQEDI